MLCCGAPCRTSCIAIAYELSDLARGMVSRSILLRLISLCSKHEKDEPANSYSDDGNVSTDRCGPLCILDKRDVNVEVNAKLYFH